MRIKSRFVVASCILASITGLTNPLQAAETAKPDETAKGDNPAAAVKAETAKADPTKTEATKAAPTATAGKAAGGARVAPAGKDAKEWKAGGKPPLAQKIPQSFQEGLIYQSMGVNDQAIGYYKQALKNDPSYVSTYNNLAQCYLDRGSKGDRDEARKLVDQALKISNKNVGTLHVIALLACQDEKFQDAEVAYKKILEIQPLNFRAVQNLSELYYYKLGKPQKAKQLLKTALKQSPQDKDNKEREVFVEALRNLDDLMKNKHKKTKVAAKPAK